MFNVLLKSTQVFTHTDSGFLINQFFLREYYRHTYLLILEDKYATFCLNIGFSNKFETFNKF